MPKTGDRIKSLDGLRAVSICLVVFSHLVGARGFIVPERVGRVFELGELGVRVFFVISGFLITSILLSELEGEGAIDLKRFYFRRTLRIFPPYYLFILILVLGQYAGIMALNGGDLLHALTYTSNYHLERSWSVGHTWSLAVEEQFYLLWPMVLLLCGKRKGLWIAVLFVLCAPMIRLASWETLPDYRAGIGQTFETAGDAIAVGCILASIRRRAHMLPAYQRFLSSKWALAAPIIVLFGNALHDHPKAHYLVGYFLMNIGIAFCIDWCVTNSDGRAGRLLNCRPVVQIGVMSYSIYLWQQIFLNRYSDSIACRFPLDLLLVAAAATASYYACERPSLKLRKSLEPRLFQYHPPEHLKSDTPALMPRPEGVGD